MSSQEYPYPNKKPKQDVAGLAVDMAEAWMSIAKNAADLAHARRTLFNAYLAEGFSEAQALELIKTP